MRSRPSPPDTQEPTASAQSYLVAGHVLAAPRTSPGLHVVATPIGNLGDITLRALETLAGADLIACEDTRVTRKLLERFGITGRLTPYHEHNAAEARPLILKHLADGKAVALVSDAGTPLISDPGFKLVREVAAAGFAVHTLPGPSSVLAALTLAALPTDRFFFEGFLPPREGARRARIAELVRLDATLVLLEAGSRITETLHDLAAGFGPRPAAVCRELTKLHEEVRRGALTELAATAAEREIRGEFVLVIAPPEGGAALMPQAALDALLRARLEHDSVKDAVAHAVEASGRPRREVYARALELAREARDGEG